MNIIVKLDVSENTRTLSIKLDELGIDQEDWDKMDNLQKHEAIKEFIYDLPEQPYWALDKFTEK